jgi:5-methyltetrahydropteroyltriglutamate--homocysteine methyltransferase
LKRSTDRILTTHAGSLVRTRPIIEGMKARALHQPFDQVQFARDIQQGIADVVRRQVEIGIDIPSDGEYGRDGFKAYMNSRLSGLEPRPLEPGEKSTQALERQVFPEFYAQYSPRAHFLWMLPEVDMTEVARQGADEEQTRSPFFRVVDRVTYTGRSSIQTDIANLKSALAGLDVADAFVPAVTPVSRRGDTNFLEFYPSEEAYLYALADELHQEYRAITDAGFILQLDYAVLNPQEHLLKSRPDASDAERLKAMELGIEITNHALRGIPEESVRYHHCWGSDNRPHVFDVPVREFAHVLLKINAQAYGVEGANPRHEHEWMVWQDVKLPDGKILIPGLISQSTNVVEHPELVAWRIKNYASVVGKENLIAGVDCGFSQEWHLIRVHPSVQWAKLQALVEGARLASRELWSD